MMMMNRVQTTYKSRRISMILEKEDGEREKEREGIIISRNDNGINKHDVIEV